MGLCFSHGISDRSYDEQKGPCHKGSLILPATLTTLLLSGKNQQIRPTKAINLPLRINRKIRRRAMSVLQPTMNYLKTIVSKTRNRHKEDGFDLDLTYITDKIIAMAFPAERMESMYRNHLNDVQAFLDLKHKDHYYIYNLRSERSYDKAKFSNRVKVYPFEDHNPPCFEMIEDFCEDVRQWLESDEKNVVAIHCKAGKGRTGTMICCYLLHTGIYNNADEAITFYGKKRTQDGQGVTIPSQIRYIKYYEQYLNEKLTYKATSVFIKKLQMKPVPRFSEPLLFSIQQRAYVEKTTKDSKSGSKDMSGESGNNEGCRDSTGEGSKVLEKINYEGRQLVMVRGYKSSTISFRSSDPSVFLDYPLTKSLKGDIRIELFYRSPVLTKKKRFARLWINTFFFNINGHRLEPGDFVKEMVFTKNELDIVWKKDKKHRQLSEDFELSVQLKIPSTAEEIQAALEEIRRVQGAERGPQEVQEDDSSGAEDDTEDEDCDSVLEKRLSDPQGVGYRILSECEIASQLITNGEYQSG